MTSITETTENAPAAPSKEPKPAKKASTRARGARVAPAKPTSGKKANPAKKARKTAPKPKGASPGKAAKGKGARNGSKTATILALLKRPDGATAKELLKAINWHAHSLRGFLSGTVRKKMGLAVTSAKGEDGERTYSVTV